MMLLLCIIIIFNNCNKSNLLRTSTDTQSAYGKQLEPFLLFVVGLLVVGIAPHPQS